MAYFVAVLVTLFKVAAWILGVLAGLVLIALSLPVRVRASLKVNVTGLLESLLDDDAVVILRTAGGSVEKRETDRILVPVGLDYGVHASLLGGSVTVRATGGRRTEAAVFGLRLPFGRRREKAGGSGAESAAPRRDERETKVPKAPRRGGRPGRRRKRWSVSIAEMRKYLSPAVRERTFAFLAAVIRALRLEGNVDAECGFPDPGLTGMVYGAYAAFSGSGALRGLSFRPSFRGELLDARGDVRLTAVPVRLLWISAGYFLSRDIRPLWRRKRRRRGSEAGLPARPVPQDG